MKSILITAFVPLLLAFIAIYKSKKVNDDDFFFSKDYGNWIKGLCAIIVIMVHFKDKYQNPLQDAIGSFAFVAVTIFFLFSAYGMQHKVERNDNYLDYFWRNKLTTLLVPCLSINILTYAFSLICTGEVSLIRLIAINDYVKVLLEYCVWFYFIMLLAKYNIIKNSRIIDVCLILGVAISSLLYYLSKTGYVISAEIGWCYERWGLVWGLIVYRYFHSLLNWLNNNRIQKILLFVFLSLIFGITYLKYKTVWFSGEYCLKIFLGLIIIIFVMLLTQKIILGNRISKLLGDVSFEIYLSHHLVMNILDYYFSDMSSGLHIVMTIALTIVLSYLLHMVNMRIVSKLRYS